MVKISVVIPVYNTEDYLEECLDSVLNQSFSDFEVICVNDGSTDKSCEILEKYQLKDSRIRIFSQENKGLGAARNTALKNIKGEYILFLDSDDYIETDALNKLYNTAADKSLDYLLFKIINFDDETGEKYSISYFDMNFVKKLSGGEVFNWKTVKDRLFNISVTAPGKLFKRQLIENISFPEGLIYEDNLFFIKSFLKAKRVCFLDEYLYCRRVRKDSITNSYYSQFSDCIEIYHLIETYLNETGLYDELSIQFFNHKCKNFHSHLSAVPEKYKDDFYNKIRKDFFDKKDKLTDEKTLNRCSKRSREIFNSALLLDSWREFELTVELFDLNNKILKLKKQNKKYQDEIKTLKNSKSRGFLRKLFVK